MSTEDAGQKGFVRLDTPRKAIEFAKKEFAWDETQAREHLGLPSKAAAKKKYVPGGPFVLTGDAELDALLISVLDTKTAGPLVVDAELQLAVAGDRWWQWREEMRFDRKHERKPRIKPTFVDKYLSDQGGKKFVYCSRKEPEKIIYTPDNDHGRADRRLLTTVGRFLTKHYAGLGETKIKAIAEEHNATYKNPTVYFALGAEDIVHAYEKGPTSCMVGKDWSALPENPIRLYDGPDAGVAYLLNAQGKISARCLIDLHESPMAFSRVYGDEPLLSARLSALGFVSKNGLAGARLRKCIDPVARLYVCPYVDWVHHVEIQGDYYIVDGTGAKKLPCQNTSGYLTSDKIPLSEIPKELLETVKGTFACGSCLKTVKQPDGHETSHDGKELCAPCVTKYYVQAIYDSSGTKRWMKKDTAPQFSDGERYNVANTRLCQALELVHLPYEGEWAFKKEAVFSAALTCWLHKDNAVAAVDGSTLHKDECRLDSDGRHVYVPHARYVLGAGGERVYYHPQFLPKNVKKVSGGFAYQTQGALV